MSRLFENAGLTYVTVVPAASINNLQQRTYCSWVKLAGYGAFVDTSLYGRGTSTYFDISDGVAFALSYYGGLFDTGQDAYSDTPDDVTPLDVWTHLAVTYDNTGDKILHYFVNGVEVSSYSTETPGDGTLGDDSADDFLIGQYNVPAPDGTGLDGRLFDFRLYDGILTEADLDVIISGGPNADPAPANLVMQLTFESDEGSTEPDASGNGNDGAITGATFSEDNPSFGTPATDGTIGVGAIFGDSLATAISNPSGLDIIHVVNEGGDVVWTLDADGNAEENPVSPTDGALNVYFGSNFVEAFGRNPEGFDIFQVKRPGGLVIFHVDAAGTAGEPTE